MSDISDEIARYREILRRYDEGETSAAECSSELDEAAIRPLLDQVEKGEGYATFGTCCSSHPPVRTFEARFTIDAHGFEIRRCSSVRLSREREKA